MSRAASRRAMLCGVAALPALTLPAVAGPSALALACDAAIVHRHWIDNRPAKHWDSEHGDDQLAVECNKVSDVKRRCVEEPSASLADLAAKARLALDDWAMYCPNEDQHDLSDWLNVAVLRDVVRLCGRAG